MNRLQFGPLAMLDQIQEGNRSAAVEKEAERLQDRPLATTPSPIEALLGGGQALTHVNLFIPMHYEPNYAYPLLVYLHGAGQNENQIQKVGPRISCRNYAAISVRSPGLRDSKQPWCQSDLCIEQAQASVAFAIDRARQRLNINPDKVFLVGEGAGGTMALRLAFQRPEPLAGVVSLNGPLPCEGAPLARLSAARQLPVYWSHCRQSRSFPESDLCAGLSLLHTAGFNLTLRQYPSDDLGCDQMYSDLNNWVMEQVTGQSS